MSFPKRVTLELSNRCNRQCDGCPRHNMTYPLGDMSISTLTNVTSQLTSNITIVPFYRGEATLNPQFTEAMMLLTRFRQVQFATNADYLTQRNQHAILNTCTFISVSLHSYLLPHQTRLTPFFYNALGNGSETQVSILDSLIPSKRHKSTFTSAWLNHVDRVRIYQTHSENGFGSMGDGKCTSPCNKPFEEMVVYWDGNVGLCNHDWNNQTPIGNADKMSIAELWRSPAYENVRYLHERGKRRHVAACKDCDFEPHHVYGEVITNG